MIKGYRVGASWYGKGGMCTIVEYDLDDDVVDERGRRNSDRLIGVVDSPEVAMYLVRATEIAQRCYCR